MNPENELFHANRKIENCLICMQIMLSKWWKTPSARAAFRRVEKIKRDRIKKLRATLKRKEVRYK